MQTCSSSSSFSILLEKEKKTRESDGGRRNRKEITTAMEHTSNLSWIDSYNTSWTREDLYLILSYGGTQYLYEKLVSNGEIENSVNLSNRQNQTIKPTRKASRYELQDHSELAESISICNGKP